MTRAQSAAASKRNRPPGTVAIDLSLAETETLVAISDSYARAMGPMRFVVVVTSPGHIREKYRFVQEESRWLRAFAETTRTDLLSGGSTELSAALTARTAVAFWGRLLASLDARRSRRKLSDEEIERRQVLSEKLERAVADLWTRKRALVETELATRRPIEVEWMRRRLEAR